MKQDLYHRLVTGTFALALAGTLALSLSTQDQAFSSTENRTLSQKPEMTAEDVQSGKFMTDYETYITDQFPGRDMLVAMKSIVEKLAGKQENNDVFFGQDNTLINRLETPSQEDLDKKQGYINALGENLEVPVYFGLIPSAATVWADRLPTGADTADETAIIQDLYAGLNSDIDTLPLVETLLDQKDQDLYYRTDHHWTSRGAYYGYKTLMETMNLSPVSLEDYQETVVSEEFYGTTFSSSGVRWLPPDSISTFVPEKESIKVTSNFTGTPVEGALYVPSFLEVKDKYSYFLGGIQPLCIIETEHTDAPSVLVIRDSYSDALAPYLTENFSEIHLLDLRFYNSGVSGYVQSAGLDQVVVLYSLTNFASDSHLFKLGM